jgi:hypothetical protein
MSGVFDDSFHLVGALNRRMQDRASDLSDPTVCLTVGGVRLLNGRSYRRRVDKPAPYLQHGARDTYSLVNAAPCSPQRLISQHM